jgi:prepilin-type N-terminal cleavage/methylation domain-containing protein
MRKSSFGISSTSGFTLVELSIVIAVMAIIVTIASIGYTSLVAKAKYASIFTNMNTIAKAGATDCANNYGVWDVAPNAWTPPPSIMAAGLLDAWPKIGCPDWYLSWDNGTVFGIDDIRITLRRANDTPVLNFCVNSISGGSCSGPDMYTGLTSPEIHTYPNNHIYCTE